MAVKLDTEKKIFMGPTAVREGTVQDVVRQGVRELDSGDGVSYEDLEKWMLENFKPNKAATFGPSYIKSYVRDALHRYGYLSHENEGHEYAYMASAEKKAAPKKKKKMTKAQQAEVDLLTFIRDQGEVSDVGDIDSTQISIQDFVTGTNKKTKTIEKNVAKLEEQGDVRTETVDGNEEGTTTIYVYLTPAGFARLSEAAEADAESTEEAEATDEA